MEHIELEVETLSPCFLGGADQSAEWRTPPFKALLRQWWRIVRASACDYDHHHLRDDEALLFGHAWLESSAPRRSRVRLCLLGEWEAGSLTDLGRDRLVQHPEVEQARNGVGANLYLGYGPLTFNKGTKLKTPPAIAPGARASLRVSFPPDTRNDLVAALRCLHWFGSVGGRSRNGWGSFALNGRGAARLPDLATEQAYAEVARMSRPLSECLKLDWPHAFGRDATGLLVWETPMFASWEDALHKVAEMKISIRTALPFERARMNSVDRRHLLAYPVTNHRVKHWNASSKGGKLSNEGRLGNQLRVKVVRRDGKFGGIFYHLPARLPNTLRDALGAEERAFVEQNEMLVWRKAHAVLDSCLKRYKLA